MTWNRPESCSAGVRNADPPNAEGNVWSAWPLRGPEGSGLAYLAAQDDTMDALGERGERTPTATGGGPGASDRTAAPATPSVREWLIGWLPTVAALVAVLGRGDGDE